MEPLPNLLSTSKEEKFQKYITQVELNLFEKEFYDYIAYLERSELEFKIELKESSYTEEIFNGFVTCPPEIISDVILPYLKPKQRIALHVFDINEISLFFKSKCEVLENFEIKLVVEFSISGIYVVKILSPICEVLGSNTVFLTMLNLSFDKIGNEGVEIIAEALETNTTLKYLDLSGNQITYLGVSYIAEALKTNTTLIYLDLGYNEIGNAGAMTLSRSLRVNQNLEALYLADNKIGDLGVERIAEALKINKTLRSLSLARNEVGEVGLKAIARALETNTALEELYFEQKSKFDLKTGEVKFEETDHKILNIFAEVAAKRELIGKPIKIVFFNKKSETHFDKKKAQFLEKFKKPEPKKKELGK